ncbi:hypothetical protein FPOAC2_00278 [Fusarium poae]
MSICDFSEDFDYCYECFMECDKLFELQICKHLRRITRLDNTALHFTKQGIETGLVFEALFKQGPRSLEYIRERAEADLICITCNWVFRNGDEARDHRIGRHLGLRDAGDNIIQLDESAARSQDLAIRAFICTVCGITCPTQERLDTHQSVGHPVAWYCSVCDRTCSTYDEMEDHNWDLHQGCVRYNIRRARATFTCTTCNMSYNDQRQLDQHVIRKHTAPPTVRYISPEGSWYCSACNRDFYSQCAVNEHNRDTHWGRRSFCLPRAYAASTCVTCNRRFNNYDELLTHTANTHHKLPTLSKLDAHLRPSLEAQQAERQKNMLKAQRAASTLSCTNCDRTFDTQVAFENHISAKVFDEPTAEFTDVSIAFFCCDRCDKYFLEEYTRDIHNQVVHDETPEKRGPDCECAGCYKTFNNQPALDHHYKTEHYPCCEKCNIIFPHGCDYDEHERLFHPRAAEDERQRLSEIEAEQQQEPERPNNPSVHDSSANNRHIEAKNVPKGFRCAPCNKTFKSQRGLKDHTRDKHGVIEIHKCTLCNKKPFCSQRALEQHRGTKHAHPAANSLRAALPDQASLNKLALEVARMTVHAMNCLNQNI